MEIYGVCFDYHRSEHEAGVRLAKGFIQITQAKQASQRSFRPKNTSRCSSSPYGRTNGAAEYWRVINSTRHGMPSALCLLLTWLWLLHHTSGPHHSLALHAFPLAKDSIFMAFWVSVMLITVYPV
ncbi:hypothetical protein BDV30DRAFT_178934 [Aspergillus minisclerotigenes]|uniref:Uncharacterized protein n=1 Tax=Aspergillus minisclerotigenes TaxID=656917 RepID=A0A5N6IT29_9EURO|nr:hypothetical protein BDV30DRAFT_178934 [Aspergillus minisclerotigenes]